MPICCAPPTLYDLGCTTRSVEIDDRGSVGGGRVGVCQRRPIHIGTREFHVAPKPHRIEPDQTELCGIISHGVSLPEGKLGTRYSLVILRPL
jgi:hypothetical protein